MDLLNKIWESIRLKIKSPALWVALILFLIKELNIETITEYSNNDIEYFINVVINILIGLGILSNPDKNIFTKKLIDKEK